MLLLWIARAVAAPSLDLADIVVQQGCAPRLVGSTDHPFIEAQLACDAFLAFRLIDEVTDGQELAPRAAALHALLSDALTPRTQAPFASTGEGPVAGLHLPRSVLYRGYVLLMLAGMAHVGVLEPSEEALYDAIAAALAEDLAATDFLPSFGVAVWPCDNALAAAGLLLHAQQRGSVQSRATGTALLARLEALRAAPGGFVTKTAPQREDVPRGTVMAWTAAFLTLADRTTGEVWAGDFAARFCDAPLPTLAACREWPRGNPSPADAVSGPLRAGYGTGATALGIVATAPHVALSGIHQGLWATARLGGLAEVSGQLQAYPLENAILLWGEGARSWGLTPAP